MPRKVFTSVLLLVALLSAAASGQSIDLKNPPQGRFVDEWFELHMGGHKIGYAHNTYTRHGDRIESGTDFHIKIGRADRPVVMDTTQTTTETLTGGAIGFESDMQLSQMKSAMRGTIKDGKITVVTSQYGLDQTQEFAFPKDALLSWGLLREQVARGFTPGTKYTLKTYAPEIRLDDAVPASVVIGDWEEFEAAGKKQRGQKMIVTMEGPTGSVEMISWVDKDGLPLKSRMVMPGLGHMEMLSVSQAQAVGDFVPPEVFMTTVLKANRKINKEAASGIRYRIKAKQPSGEPLTLPETDSQKVMRIDEQTVEVMVSRLPHKNAETPKAKNAETPKRKNAETTNNTNGELTEYLEPNLMMNTADEKLVALAKEAAGSEKDPYKLADKLRRFVTEYVTTKSLNVGFATASEVARTREGDCSEHGVLLAALGRLNGLPSRVAVGIAYVPIFGGQDDIFGYHLWTQFFIDGKWIDFDAALRESDCSPIRITFAVSSLKNSGVADLSLPLITKIGAIDLDILSIEPK